MIDNFISTEKARMDVYQILSALFCQPEKDLIQNQDVFIALGNSLTTLQFNNTDPTGNLLSASRHYSIQELLIEYTRLFIGPFKTLVPPYGSVHLQQERMLFTQDTIRVRDFYLKTGFEFNDQLYELPDHFVVETEFMYALIHHELTSLEKGDIPEAMQFYRHQKEFLQQHYLVWVPKFCQEIIKNTENEYYKILASILHKFVLQVHVPEFPQEHSSNIF